MLFNSLTNKKVLITAGPTREAIDPVRYISNHSSGKMGYAIAEAFLKNGAEVILVSGQVNISLSHPKLKLVSVTSASEMYFACCRYFEEIDIAIFAAAVADYRPTSVSEQKIKKDGDTFLIKMVKNIDIAYEFGQIKSREQISVGFALETNDEMKHAAVKLKKKNLDFVVLNSMNDGQATFGFDTNKITVIRKDLSTELFELKNKSLVAKDIMIEVRNLLDEKHLIAEAVVEYENMYR